MKKEYIITTIIFMCISMAVSVAAVQYYYEAETDSAYDSDLYQYTDLSSTDVGEELVPLDYTPQSFEPYEVSDEPGVYIDFTPYSNLYSVNPPVRDSIGFWTKFNIIDESPTPHFTNLPIAVRFFERFKADPRVYNYFKYESNRDLYGYDIVPPHQQVNPGRIIRRSMYMTPRQYALEPSGSHITQTGRFNEHKYCGKAFGTWDLSFFKIPTRSIKPDTVNVFCPTAASGNYIGQSFCIGELDVFGNPVYERVECVVDQSTDQRGLKFTIVKKEEVPSSIRNVISKEAYGFRVYNRAYDIF